MSGVQHPRWLRGLQRTFGVENPPAGKDWLFKIPSVPEGVWWKVKTARWKLTTSAAVANRLTRFGFFLTENADAYALAPTSNQQAASLVTDNFFQEAGGAIGAFNDTLVKTGVLPFDLKLQPGQVIGSQTGAMDIADQITGVVICLEENIYVPPVDYISGLPDALKQINDSMLKVEKAVLAVFAGGAPT